MLRFYPMRPVNSYLTVIGRGILRKPKHRFLYILPHLFLSSLSLPQHRHKLRVSNSTDLSRLIDFEHHHRRINQTSPPVSPAITVTAITIPALD
ncbi:hypothetical protein HanPSC8_Chr08g0333631 [Helianthus annuus]|nr:hypothetical protein HanPSC8_Chr08g0333631 [Helianthus annuus]